QHADSGAHGVPIAPRADQLEIEKVIGISAAVVQQQRRVSIIGDDYIHETVVVKVCEGDSPAYRRSFETTARHLRRLHKFAFAFVVEKRVDLLEVRTGRSLLHLGINMTVRDKEIQPTVVVVVEKASAKTEHFFRGTGDSCFIANFFEASLSVIVPDMVRRLLEIGYVQVEPAIVVVVAQRNTHRS